MNLIDLRLQYMSKLFICFSFLFFACNDYVSEIEGVILVHNPEKDCVEMIREDSACYTHIKLPDVKSIHDFGDNDLGSQLTRIDTFYSECYQHGKLNCSSYYFPLYSNYLRLCDSIFGLGLEDSEYKKINELENEAWQSVKENEFRRIDSMHMTNYASWDSFPGFMIVDIAWFDKIAFLRERINFMIDKIENSQKKSNTCPR
jgi:hypothetical protein